MESDFIACFQSLENMLVLFHTARFHIGRLLLRQIKDLRVGQKSCYFSLVLFIHNIQVKMSMGQCNV